MRFLALCAVLSSAVAVNVDVDLHAEWHNFKLTHNKEYETPEEENRRLEIFHENLKIIKEQNARYEAGIDTHLLGVTPFADLTDSEFIERTKCRAADDESDTTVPVFQSSGFKAPAYYDWRNYRPRIVQPPRDQETCGSCWAHAAAEIAESSASLMLNWTYYPLSPQNLVDCLPDHCISGSMTRALEYIMHNGIAWETHYPYLNYQGVCQHRPSAYIRGYYRVANEVDMKEALVRKGPMGVSVDAREWKLYRGGIFTAYTAFVDLSHSLVVDGYGNDRGLDYWLLRNSWGPYWGEGGYIRIRRNTNEFGVSDVVVVVA